MNQVELSDQDKRDLRRFARALGAAWALGPWGYLLVWWGCKAWDEIATDTRRARRADLSVMSSPHVTLDITLKA